MADTNSRLSIKDLRSGRNNVDPPQSLSETTCVDATNVDWFNATVCRKRGGVASVSTTGSTFTGQTISSLFRHVPTTDETASELWATDDNATPKIGRLAGGTVWAYPTLKDVPTGNGWDFTAASLNGLLFLAYKSGQDRLHAYDPAAPAGVSVRRTGLAAMAVPTVADTGAGTYAATLRYYRTRATYQSAGVTKYRSEYSTSVAFTPSGSGTAARVTQGTLPGEGESHWEVEASTDNTTFYRIATVAIGTTTYDDSAATTAYANSPASAVAGTYTLQKSYKFIAADQNRLLGFGAWTGTNPQNRVEYSAVLGASDISDVERVPTNNYQALDENDSGVATGLIGPVNGSFFPFKYRQLWQMTPSGNATTPYNVRNISKVVGAVGPQAIAVGEDEIGNTALYFTSHRGPYRYGLGGLEYLGKRIEDKTIGANGGVSLNLGATNVVSHVRWYGDKRQVWFWFATGANNDPDTLCVFSLGRQYTYSGSHLEPPVPSGWSTYTGGIATARASVLYANTLGATQSRDLKPYIASSAATNTLGKCDSGTQDLGANYKATVTTRAYAPWGDGWSGTIMGATLTAPAATGVTITVSTVPDFGAQATRVDTASLTAVGSETRVQPRVGGAVNASGMYLVQFIIGDAAAANNSWQIDDVTITYRKEGPGIA